MWVICSVCGALVADFWLHGDWHQANGEPHPVLPPYIVLDPPVDPTPDPPIEEETPNGG